MKYAAEDGKVFDTAKECREYEKSLKKAAETKPPELSAAEVLSEATQEDFLEAMAGKRPELAKHIEAAARFCRNARYAAGDFKSKPKRAPAPVAAEAAPPVPPQAEPLPAAAE
ncbi:hypothetical protein [uncultured Alsobacter sp.]|uniref:hypothetical protein n=1 Tax=uncultured Alsobacter sp. TaxID=1748258 RepID=UPI0025D2F601|nr:hypothetical protein [uncultured Alsobacter sp.]